MPWDSRGVARFYPRLTWQSRPQVGRVLASVPPGGRIVDLGAGGRRIAPGVTCLDRRAGPGTDVQADAHHLPLKDGCLDLLVATGLLEHVADHRQVLAEIARVLKPGGLVHVEMPFVQQFHEDPGDYRRLTQPGLEAEIRRAGLEPVGSGWHIGPTVALITLAAHYGALWFDGRGRMPKLMSAGVFAAVSAMLFPFRYLDRLLVGRSNAHRLAFGVFCTARRGPAGAAAAR